MDEDDDLIDAINRVEKGGEQDVHSVVSSQSTQPLSLQHDEPSLTAVSVPSSPSSLPLQQPSIKSSEEIDDKDELQLIPERFPNVAAEHAAAETAPTAITKSSTEHVANDETTVTVRSPSTTEEIPDHESVSPQLSRRASQANSLASDIDLLTSLVNLPSGSGRTLPDFLLDDDVLREYASQQRMSE